MITDKMLSQAASELASAISDSLPSSDLCTHQFSSEFDKKMKHLITRANHPMRIRAINIAACFLLFILLGFSSILALNVEARENFVGWIKQQYESFYQYFYIGSHDLAEYKDYYPSWLPNGYSFKTSIEKDGGKVLIFADSYGNIAHFSYSTVASNTAVYIENVDAEHIDVQINDLDADLYISTSSEQANGIIWTNSSGDTLFAISAPIEPDGLIKMAEKIVKK